MLCTLRPSPPCRLMPIASLGFLHLCSPCQRMTSTWPQTETTFIFIHGSKLIFYLFFFLVLVGSFNSVSINNVSIMASLSSANTMTALAFIRASFYDLSRVASCSSRTEIAAIRTTLRFWVGPFWTEIINVLYPFLLICLEQKNRLAVSVLSAQFHCKFRFLLFCSFDPENERAQGGRDATLRTNK